MNEIKDVMEDIAKLGPMKRFARRASIREQRVKCKDRLDLALRNFTVSLFVHHAPLRAGSDYRSGSLRSSD